MRLTDEQTGFLRERGNALSPAVQIGAGGLTKFVLRQIDHALATQELIKVQVPYGDRRRRADVLDSLGRQTNAIVIQRANSSAVLFRRAEKPVIDLPGYAAMGVGGQRAAQQA